MNVTMVNISLLIKIGRDKFSKILIACSAKDDISTNLTMSRTVFFSIMVRGLILLISLALIFSILTFDLSEKVTCNVYFQLIPALFSLMLLLPCFYRIVTQRLSQYLLIFNLFPLISYFLYNTLVLSLNLVFLLYLFFLNIYSSNNSLQKKSIALSDIREKEYPVGGAMLLVLLLFIFTFSIFGTDEVSSGLILLSWTIFALIPFYRLVVWMRVFEGLCIAIYFVFEVFDIKHHQNFLINALIKISMPEVILILISCINVFLNFLFWLDEKKMRE